MSTNRPEDEYDLMPAIREDSAAQDQTNAMAQGVSIVGRAGIHKRAVDVDREMAQGASIARCAGGIQRIVRAAIRRGAAVYSVARPGRHHDILAMMSEHGVPGPGGDIWDQEQGFLTSDGEFVGRARAVAIAEDAGQVVKKTDPAHLLFSEDLW